MKIFTPLVALILAFQLAGFAQPSENVTSEMKEDAYGVQKNADVKTLEAKSIKELAEALCAEAISEEQKVRNIYTWIAANICYDFNLVGSPNFNTRNATITLKNKKGICTDFSLLFDQLCKEAGISSKTIIGYARDPKSDGVHFFTQPNHTWNVALIDNEWQLFDVTWACKNASRPVFADHNQWNDRLNANFKVDPEIFIQTHFPEDPQWQLLNDKISFEAFSAGTFTTYTDTQKATPPITSDTDSLDYIIAYNERAEGSTEASFMHIYNLSVAYYYKAQETYKKMAADPQSKGNLVNEIILYYDKALGHLNVILQSNENFDMCESLLNTISQRKELLISYL